MMRMEKNTNRKVDYQLPGIVLIDEIETHLHLKIQRDILMWQFYLNNCCKKDPDIDLEFRINSGNVVVSTKDNKGEESGVTAELMNEVFNKKNIGMRVYSSKVRVNEFYQEMNVFLDCLEKYKKDQTSSISRRMLKGLLAKSSRFAKFKRSYIKDYEKNDEQLLELIK